MSNIHVEITIHDILREVKEVRAISLRTLYLWLEKTNIGAGRVYYTPQEKDALVNYAIRQNNSRPFSAYENRLKNAQAN